MVCNCNNIQNENDTIQFISGTTVDLLFTFDEDISSYTNAKFTIRKNYETTPVVNKTVSISSDNTIDITLTPAETALFTEFANGQNSAKYIWGLNVIDSESGIKTNVFPQVGNSAPLCIVYKHVVEEV